jgi:hypothetical protein
LSICFRQSQLEKLRSISQKQGISLSAAARNVLADFLVESDHSLAAVQEQREVRGPDRVMNDQAIEACYVNLRKRQYDHLSSIAQRVGATIDEVLGFMVERYR